MEFNAGELLEVLGEMNIFEVIEGVVIAVPTHKLLAIPTPPVVDDVESVVPVIESDGNEVVPEIDKLVAETPANVLVPVTVNTPAVIAANVLVPDTFKFTPMYRLLEIPTPPPIITLPVVEDVESVAPVMESEDDVKAPDTYIPVAETAANVLIPETVIPVEEIEPSKLDPETDNDPVADTDANAVTPETEIEVTEIAARVEFPEMFIEVA